MTRLPVLYLCCETRALNASKGQASLFRLIGRDRPVESVLFITAEEDSRQPEIVCQNDKAELAERLQSSMKSQGFDIPISVPLEPDLLLLARSMTQLLSAEVIELRLSIGMTSQRYLEIGQCIENFRDRGVLLICLDRMQAEESAASHPQPHDSYMRNLIKQWEDEQRWVRVLANSSLRDNHSSSDPGSPVSDPTLCVLNTAFSLGGMKAPERLFGFSLNENSQALAGYGWMQ
ncbi:hypothetical protein [Marinobacter sp.]|uniref:hypothetical protein n=1 Tax=Marinobacter sp. TaxID=50741 RepID=UPI003850A91B